MSEPGGILYKTRGVFRSLSRYPNVRLIVVGVLLWFVSPLVIGTTTNIADRMRRPPQERCLEAPPLDRQALSSIVLALVATIITTYAAFILVGFAVLRIAWNQLRRLLRVTPPAPIPDAGFEAK